MIYYKLLFLLKFAHSDSIINSEMGNIFFFAIQIQIDEIVLFFFPCYLYILQTCHKQPRKKSFFLVMRKQR